MNSPTWLPWIIGLALFSSLPASANETGTVDLRQRYPTSLTSGDTDPARARAWEFTGTDIYRLSDFHLEISSNLSVTTGPADLGIGHGTDGAVWAVLMPREGGRLVSGVTNQPEIPAHLWLRFHPGQINVLFPPPTVFPDGATNLLWQMQAIAHAKITASWQADGKALIPETNDLTVDVDTQNGPRRFFIVDTRAGTATYENFFATRSFKLPAAFTRELAAEAFDQLWQAFDEKYAMFVLRPEVDWARLREQYRPQALASQSTWQFATVCADMLRPLRDLHVWLSVAGMNVPVFNRPRTANANPKADRAILGGLSYDGMVDWAVTSNHIGYLVIYGWNHPQTPVRFNQALEQMRDTRGLIVDVRLNGGGGEPLAEKVAGRFLKEEFTYAYSQYRNGSNHTNLTEKYPRRVAPAGPWRYDRPVILLIGQKCMSSNESFIGMMTGDPQVTTMGDHTCGSSGNPEIIQLPLGITVSVPQWIDYLPDGTPLDEHGFVPQVPFTPGPDAFAAHRDDLLRAALDRLASVPLPATPISGPVFEASNVDLHDHKAVMQAEARDAARPQVISVTPANDATNVPCATELRIRFDRPMDPLAINVVWETGGFSDSDYPQYDPVRHEFKIPVRLAPGTTHQLVLNNLPFWAEDPAKARRESPRDGFQSTDHRLAGLFVWRFQTEAAPVPMASQPPRVIKLTPAPDSQVAALTFLEVQFDQPMAPPNESLLHLPANSSREAPRMISRVEYDPATHAFRIPLLLVPNRAAPVTLTGFRSVGGMPAEPILLQYQVTNADFLPADQARIQSGAADPQLLQQLALMKQQRSRISAIDERVQSLDWGQEGAWFKSMASSVSYFKWQQPGRYFADATGPMSMCDTFQIGSDGHQWWWFIQSARDTNFVTCPAAEMTEINDGIGDPFGLQEDEPATAANQLGLNWVKPRPDDGTNAPLLLETCNVQRTLHSQTFGSISQWRIARSNGLPQEVTLFMPDTVSRTRFVYDAINTPLPDKDFAPPQFTTPPPAPKEKLDPGFHRFVNVRDGSDGRMSLRWGTKSTNEVYSSGLN